MQINTECMDREFRGGFDECAGLLRHTGRDRKAEFCSHIKRAAGPGFQSVRVIPRRETPETVSGTRTCRHPW